MDDNVVEKPVQPVQTTKPPINIYEVYQNLKQYSDDNALPFLSNTTASLDMLYELLN